MEERESWQNIGQRIRQLRKGNQLTLKQLAAGCDLSVNAISLIERGRVAPTVMTLCKIAHALGVSAGSLFQDICPSEVILTRATESQKDQLDMVALRTLTTKSAQECGVPNAGPACSLPSKMTQMILCVCGSLKYEANGLSYRLHPGDQLIINGNAFQRWTNPESDAGIAVMVLTPLCKNNE